jgi:NAD(P)-dependent dehydrogenase (short-subunit alcohol dehydrogenase family)
VTGTSSEHQDGDGRADPLDFSGAAVIVTGGTRGVGRIVTTTFLDAGADVVICGRHAPAHEDLPTAAGRSAVFVTADVREPDQAATVVQSTVERFGRLDVLVNNAGGAPMVDADTMSTRLFTSVVTLNLLAPFYCAQAANLVMRDQAAGGSIVNIASVSGVRASPGASAYGAAKAGLVNLTKTLAVEWAPKVRLNCIVAGLIATEAADDHYGGAEGLARVAATVPLGRMGTPADLAGICLFLASPLASYISGASLQVDGGGEWPAYLAAVERSEGS